MSEDRRRQTGLAGETAACQYLENGGYTVIERNWRCRSGEIDIIATIDDTLVFVEVRTRRAGGRFGTAAESVDRRKQQQVALVAQVYLRMRHLTYPPMRFDVIAVTMNRDDSIGEIKHVKAAF
ncbi:YraN family protein [Paenibacillus glycanilyticus]|uniref:YraN family protein n=1 Tax=Paenibacillus glycanilyticus TaxID=126569 RepID=UPI003EBD07AC